MAVSARALLTATLAVLLTYSGVAAGVCAILCNTGVCCEQPHCAPPPEAGCCEKGKKPEKAKTCCEVMAEYDSGDQSLTERAQVSLYDAPILPAQVVWLESSNPGIQTQVLGSPDERGPPGPFLSSIRVRAPPIYSV